jgi:toxin ParE1/3/4
VRFRLTRLADQDITNILRETLRSFGPRQVSHYAEIIDRAIQMVAEDPLRPSSLDRSDIKDRVRSFHLELVAGRRGAASHKLYYAKMADRDQEPIVVILRVLHERMEPKHRLLRALRHAGESTGD